MILSLPQRLQDRTTKGLQDNILPGSFLVSDEFFTFVIRKL